MQSTETKYKIIKKTFELLLLKGYDGVSISDLQKATGISRGLLYHYFGNKETLFIEVCKKHFLDLFQIDSKEIKLYDLAEMRKYIIKKYIKLTKETLKGVSIINYDFLFFRVMQESNELTVLYENVRNEELKAWRSALHNSERKGELRPNLNLDKIAEQIIYITDGIWLRAVTPSAEKKIDLIKSLKEALKTLFSLIKQETNTCNKL